MSQDCDFIDVCQNSHRNMTRCFYDRSERIKSKATTFTSNPTRLYSHESKTEMGQQMLFKYFLSVADIKSDGDNAFKCCSCWEAHSGGVRVKSVHLALKGQGDIVHV